MKHKAFLLAAMLFCLTATAQRQQVVVQHDMQVLPPYGTQLSEQGQNQGFALLRGPLGTELAVVLRSGGQYVTYNLRTRKIGRCGTLEGTTSHCNNASATRRGLLWVSECYGQHRCMVYNTRDNRLMLTHIISYRGNENWFAYDWCVDERADRLYVYGGNMGESLWIKELPLAKSLTAREVEYTADEVLRQTEIRGIAVPQGSLVRNGRAYLLDGDQPDHTYLHVYDLATGQRLLQMPVGGDDLEPEGLDLRGRWAYISFSEPSRTKLHIIRYRLPR